MKILITDDEKTSLTFLGGILDKFGEVFYAYNGQEALDMYISSIDEEKPFDLIFLDILMPVMDGNVALKKIRSIEKKYGISNDDRVKIIMVTSRDDLMSVYSSFQLKCDEYIVKPYEKNAIITKMKKIGINL